MAKWNRKGLTPEEREKRKEALRQQVEGIINNFENSPESIVEYLEFNSKFHQYSTNNTILIYEQNEFAQFCASYKAFQDMGYQVQKGQTGMKIFVPYITTVFHDPESDQWIKLSEGTKEQKALVKAGQLESKQYTSFGIGTVFDIGQTDCPPEDYPKLLDMGFASETHNRLYQALVNYAESQNISVEEKFLPTITTRGYYKRSENSITISDKLNDSMKLSVMSHELAHALMHNAEDDANKNEYPNLSKILDNVNKAYTGIVDDFDKSITNYLELHQDSIQHITLDDYLRQCGLYSPVSDFMVDKMRIPRGLTQRQQDKLDQQAQQANEEYHRKRDAAIKKYNQKVASGEIVQPTNLERYIEAAKGHPDNSSTQAAIRALTKRGYTQDSNGNWIKEHKEISQKEKDFSQTIDDFLNGKINPSDHIFVCQTTNIMKICGADNLDVMIYQDTIKKILSDDFNKFEHPHNLTVDTLKQLPDQLQKPVMVFKGSHESSIVLVTDLFNENNEQIIISCELDSGSQWNKINRITSMYGKENIANYLNTQIEKGNLIGCHKKIANQMLHSVGLYLPSENTFIDYTDIISNLDENVNDQPLKNDFRTILNNQLEETNELPVDILCDEGKIQWYSFSTGINNTEKVKGILQNIQRYDKQVVSIFSNSYNHQLVHLDEELQLVPYDESIYPDADAALKAILANDNIAKLVPYEDMLQASTAQDLTILSNSSNSKYPYIKINHSDNPVLVQEGYLPFDKADKLFQEINDDNLDEGPIEKANVSLFLDSQNTYNFDIKFGIESGGVSECFNRLVNEGDINSDKSLQHLQEYLKENGLTIPIRTSYTARSV